MKNEHKMSTTELYFKLVINPIEKEIKEIHQKLYSKNIIDIFFKNTYETQLEKYESLLFEKLEKLDKCYLVNTDQ